MESLGQALSNFENKLRWRMMFHDAPERKWSHLCTRGSQVAPCNFPMDDHVEQFFIEMKTDVFEACRKAAGRWRALRTGIAARNRIARLAIAWLRKGSIGALPTDKDGGFALLPKVQIQRQFAQIVNSVHYVRIPWSFELDKELFCDFSLLIQKLGRLLKDEEWVRSMLHDGKTRGTGGMISRMGATVKTHKPPGEVALRAIHQSHTSPMKPAMKWVAGIMSPVIKSIPFLLRDSAHLTSILKKTTISSECQLWKIDVKDFSCRASTQS